MHVRVCRPFAYRRDYAREVTSRKVLGRNGQNVRSRNRSLYDSRAHRTRWPAAATAQEDSHTPTGGRPATSGGVTIFLCGGGGRPACPVRAGIVQGTITAANVLAIPTQDLAAGDLASIIAAIREGATYANVHSRKRPGARS